jgi:hypothetical protein
MKKTQTMFWAVNMGKPPLFNPVSETEYMVRASLKDAETDGALVHTASTYDSGSERLWPGIGARGPRVLTFAPLLTLDRFRFNDALKRLMSACEDLMNAAVEIEFAATLAQNESGRSRLGLLQVRPMIVSEEQVSVTTEELARSDFVVSSTRVIGNGTDQSICDVVYVKPSVFEPAKTRAIAGELQAINARLRSQNRPYLLIGFGRWGSSEPWLGIPVTWDQISEAKVIVEATLPNMLVEMSQGSHFFHNLTSFRVCYLMIRHTDKPGVNWPWLDAQPAEAESENVRHIRLRRPLLVMVDGRSRRGVIRWTS